MSTLRLLRDSWRLIRRHLHLIVRLYVLILTVAILIVWPAKTLLESYAGNSLLLSQLNEGFNYTFLNDFKNAYGAGWVPLFQQSVLSFLVLLVAIVFFMAGAVPTLLNQRTSAGFWGNGGYYFWRMLRLTVYFGLLHLGLAGLTFWIYTQWGDGLSLEALSDDTVLVYRLYYLAPVYLILTSWILIWQDSAKAIIIQTEATWLFRPIARAFRQLARQWATVYPVYVLHLLLIAALVAWGALRFDHWLVTFLVAQVALVLRMALRLANLAVVVAWYKKKLL